MLSEAAVPSQHQLVPKAHSGLSTVWASADRRAALVCCRGARQSPLEGAPRQGSREDRLTDYPNPALPALEAKLARGMPLDGPALVKSPLRGDLSNSGLKDQAAVKEAAVLIPLIFKDGILSILFTQRPETMKEHPGQISFPGTPRNRRILR